jgi:hypothetical protein
MKAVFNGGYGRVGNIHVSMATCTICDTPARCLSVDTSDGEYATAYICKSCADKLF